MKTKVELHQNSDFSGSKSDNLGVNMQITGKRTSMNNKAGFLEKMKRLAESNKQNEPNIKKI